jgi:8-oxo-dGTP pyrophosphatase MutT (NUDIX family)
VPTSLSSTPFPDYCCAILRNPSGLYLMEKRPVFEADPQRPRITCFGGTRHDNEHPDDCIRRELLEELGWTINPSALEFRLRLTGTRNNQPREIAWFYRTAAPSDESALTLEPGVEALWLTFEQTQELSVSAWHRVALAAERAGERLVRVVEPRGAER